jgi:hypothetical protein
MVAAIGQVAGAIATATAVAVSLHLARTSRSPRLSVKVGERLVFEGGDEPTAVLMFSVTNIGDRIAHIRGVGWSTGWLSFGPECVRQRHAIQLTAGDVWGHDVPFVVAPAEEKATYCFMENVLEHSRERVNEPLFTRDLPGLGRKRTRIRAWVSTAEGMTFKVRPERSLIDSLQQAEQQALLTARTTAS